MEITRSKERADIIFCCEELYREVCEKVLPRIRLGMERDGNVRPTSNDTIFKFCPFCGKVVQTTLIMEDGKVKILPQQD